jgi:hypothetical protein
MLALLNGRGMSIIPPGSQPRGPFARGGNCRQHSLYLSATRGYDSLIRALQEAPLTTRHVFLDHCNLKRVPEEIRRFKHLETLSLVHNPRLVLFPSWFEAFLVVQQKRLVTLVLPNGEVCRNRKKIREIAPALVQGAKERERKRTLALLFVFGHKKKELGVLNELNRATIIEIAQLIYRSSAA